MTAIEQNALLRLALALHREWEEMQQAMENGIEMATVRATLDLAEALTDWRRLRLSPSGKLLYFPSDEQYRPGAGPCNLCREPGEGSRCQCYLSTPAAIGAPLEHRTGTGALLRVLLSQDGAGTRCGRDLCPQYQFQADLPGTGDDRARSRCAITGTAPETYCRPRALDIVLALHERAVRG